MTDVVFLPQAAAAPRMRATAPALDQLVTEAMNFAVALMAILFLSPLFIALAALIFVQDGGPPVFAHRRIGRDGRHFRCLKFRSMRVDAEARLSELLERDPEAR